MKRAACDHSKRYACRVETDAATTAFVIVCATCGQTRSHSHMFLGLFHDWKRQVKERYPRGARFTILAGPSGNDEPLKDATVQAIRAMQFDVDSSSEACSKGGV